MNDEAKDSTEESTGGDSPADRGALLPPEPPRVQSKTRTSGMAVASMVLGILGLLACPFIGAVLALIFGISAKSDIRRSGGTVKGSGMATVGITLGAIGIILPLILIAVVVPLGLYYVRPEIRAAGNLLDGAAAARIYYFENGDSYAGADNASLAEIDNSVDFRMAPGRDPDVVYIDKVTDESLRLYCCSTRGHRYAASARGDEWRYFSKWWSGSALWVDE